MQRGSAVVARLVALLVAAAGFAARAEEEAPYRLRRIAVDEAGGGDATLAPDGKRFVSTSRRDGDWDVWVYEIERGEWTQITDHPEADFEARFSPDGTRLAFTSTREGSKDVWVISLQDGSLRRLTSSPHDDEYPAWSPDGGRIVYTGGPWGQRDVFEVPAAGGSPRRLTRSSGAVGACTYFPDDTALACHRYDDGSGDLFRLRRSDGSIVPLTAGGAWDYKPSVSGAGDWLAFSRSREGPSSIWLLPAAGGRPRRLTDSPYDDRWPTWSASGESLLFHRIVEHGAALRLLDRRTRAVREIVGPEEAPLQASLDPRMERVVYCSQQEQGEGGRRVLRIANLRDGTHRTLDSGPGEACFPRWSPDGEWIAFASKPAERWEIAVVRADGTGLRILTQGISGIRGMDGPLDWAPDGSRIVFHADTAPFEADLFTIDPIRGELAALTADAHFDEAPAWSPDGGSVLFMSTRGGDWTWGLYRLRLDDGSITTLRGPDYTEKNFLRTAAAGTMTWTTRDPISGAEVVVESAPSGDPESVASGARWSSFSADGRYLLYTQVVHRVEYWLAEHPLGPGSPLHVASEAPARPSPGWTPGDRDAVHATRLGAGSPVDLTHR